MVLMAKKPQTIQEYLDKRWHVIYDCPEYVILRNYKFHWVLFAILLFFGGIGLIYGFIYWIIPKKTVKISKRGGRK